jgi:hypothetical protein
LTQIGFLFACHRHAAWQKDNEAIIRNSGMKLSCLRSAGWKIIFFIRAYRSLP